jgi:UDP-N-acetyl-2-amino-2-deoxyglucuronate dehydrogenase
MKNFAIIGAAGYIAPRHLDAIRATGNRLVAAVDPHDSVGILDSYFPDCSFFTEIERFDRHLEKLRRLGEDEKVDYVTVCSPNYLHDAHVRLGLRVQAHAICEKPLVANSWNLDGLAQIEQESGKRVYTVLQLRVHPALIALRDKLLATPKGEKFEVDLTYVTRRGTWYLHSWKGNEEKSGGIVQNIGIHFFDLLMWYFGGVERSDVHLLGRKRA